MVRVTSRPWCCDDGGNPVDEHPARWFRAVLRRRSDTTLALQLTAAPLPWEGALELSATAWVQSARGLLVEREPETPLYSAPLCAARAGGGLLPARLGPREARYILLRSIVTWESLPGGWVRHEVGRLQRDRIEALKGHIADALMDAQALAPHRPLALEIAPVVAELDGTLAGEAWGAFWRVVCSKVSDYLGLAQNKDRDDAWDGPPLLEVRVTTSSRAAAPVVAGGRLSLQESARRVAEVRRELATRALAVKSLLDRGQLGEAMAQAARAEERLRLLAAELSVAPKRPLGLPRSVRPAGGEEVLLATSEARYLLLTCVEVGWWTIGGIHAPNEWVEAWAGRFGAADTPFTRARRDALAAFLELMGVRLQSTSTLELRDHVVALARALPGTLAVALLPRIDATRPVIADQLGDILASAPTFPFDGLVYLQHAVDGMRDALGQSGTGASLASSLDMAQSARRWFHAAGHPLSAALTGMVERVLVALKENRPLTPAEAEDLRSLVSDPRDMGMIERLREELSRLLPSRAALRTHQAERLLERVFGASRHLNHLDAFDPPPGTRGPARRRMPRGTKVFVNAPYVDGAASELDVVELIIHKTGRCAVFAADEGGESAFGNVRAAGGRARDQLHLLSHFRAEPHTGTPPGNVVFEVGYFTGRTLSRTARPGCVLVIEPASANLAHRWQDLRSHADGLHTWERVRDLVELGETLWRRFPSEHEQPGSARICLAVEVYQLLLSWAYLGRRTKIDDLWERRPIRFTIAPRIRSSLRTIAWEVASGQPE